MPQETSSIGGYTRYHLPSENALTGRYEACSALRLSLPVIAASSVLSRQEAARAWLIPLSEERLTSPLRTDGIEVNREPLFEVANDEIRQAIPTVELSLSHLAQGGDPLVSPGKR